MENNLFLHGGYSPGEELDILFRVSNLFLGNNPIPNNKSFFGEHTITLLTALNSYSSLAGEFCLKPQPFTSTEEVEEHKNKLRELLNPISTNLYRGLIELMSFMSNRGIGSIHVTSYLQENMISLNISGSFFQSNPLASLLSMARYSLLYKYQLGNFNYMSNPIDRYLNIPKCLGSTVSINLVDYLKDVIVKYLSDTSVLIQSMDIDPGGFKQEKEIYIKNTLCNLLFDYFSILELLGVNQNTMLSYFTNQLKDNKQDDEDKKQ